MNGQFGKEEVVCGNNSCKSKNHEHISCEKHIMQTIWYKIFVYNQLDLWYDTKSNLIEGPLKRIVLINIIMKQQTCLLLILSWDDIHEGCHYIFDEKAV